MMQITKYIALYQVGIINISTSLLTFSLLLGTIYGRSGPTTPPAPVDAAPIPIRPKVDPAPYY